MRYPVLESIDISNFRSIRGQIHVPLDAQVVLVHGENGAGKTSLLSALELALTGRVQSLERADPEYQKQLLHRTANSGRVMLKTKTGSDHQEFAATIDAFGTKPINHLGDRLASFFRERAFLPQSMLGQLIQIYQEAGSDAESPLAQFVGRLLGLDQLDAIEAGLKPLGDVRNVRKYVDGWAPTEALIDAAKRSIDDCVRNRSAIDQQNQVDLVQLRDFSNSLGVNVEVTLAATEQLNAAFADNGGDAQAVDRLTDARRRLGSIRREIEAAKSGITAVSNPTAGEDPGLAYARWEKEFGTRVSVLRDRVSTSLPEFSAPSDQEEFATAAMPLLAAAQKQLADRVAQARADLVRFAVAQDEREVAVRQRETIDVEVAGIGTPTSSLASVLAEISMFIEGDICPVCGRDFQDLNGGSLHEHVNSRVKSLSATAERVLALGRSRSEIQVMVERLDREIAAILVRKLSEEALAELDRRLATLNDVTSDLRTLTDALREGSRLRSAEVSARRSVSEAQSRSLSLAAARETLTAFALSVSAAPVAEGEPFEAAAARIDAFLASQVKILEDRLQTRRRAGDHIAKIQATMAQRADIEKQLSTAQASLQLAETAMGNAKRIRENGNEIREAVDKVRSAIIRREFNDRLNRVWRDLFVRLAPVEPFVPAFRIPESSTQRLQPKLYTEYRDGGTAGGTPGVMLSSGNLNTAALTLFIALNLAVPAELPWLILDDPVQSMDDVHIAHFAALLRTLAKELDRQVIIAVHNRQLFEYLRLELSPAFPGDSLMTLELSRGPTRDSQCLPDRLSYKQETAIETAA